MTSVERFVSLPNHACRVTRVPVTGTVEVQSRAEAIKLDSADGRIDGKVFGTPIHVQGASASALRERDVLIDSLRFKIGTLEAQLAASSSKVFAAEESLRKELAEEREKNHKLHLKIRQLEEGRTIEEEERDREQTELINLQRRLLQEKDAEIRNLSHLAAAHKEQISILFSQLNMAEVDEILLDDNFDVRNTDLDALPLESRQRIGSLLPPVDDDVVEAKDQYTALAIDLADGRADGKLFGSDIRVTEESQRKGAIIANDRTNAAILDAADGRIDGQFFDSDIRVSDSAQPRVIYRAKPGSAPRPTTKPVQQSSYSLRTSGAKSTSTWR